MLSPYRVLDLTDARAELGPLILAGLGAEVIKVEPPGGSASRQATPLDATLPPGLQSLRFHAFNRGKRSVVLDLEHDDGRAAFYRLVASADFLFENAAPGAMAARGLAFAALRESNPRLVYVAITPFGQDGPYAQHVATDLTLAAMGGMMALNGDRDRRPVRVTVPQTWYHAAAESAVAALVAHARCLASGEAQFVDVSVQAAVFWTGLNAMIAHAIQGKNIERNGTLLQLSTLTTPLVYPCADGEVVLVATTATLDRLVPWMLEDGTVTEEWVAAEDWTTYEARMLTAANLVHSLDTVRERIRAFCTKYRKAELFARGVAGGATLAPVNTVADVLALEHLETRRYWQWYRLPDDRALRMPGPFVRLSRTPIEYGRPAPAIGEHSEEILAAIANRQPVMLRDAPSGAPQHERVPFSDKTHSVRPEEARSAVSKPVLSPVEGGTSRGVSALPFAGVKVADFSWIGVGPITAKYLADHGATVVHVETEHPADRLRLVGPFKDNIPGPNRCHFFAAFNTSKHSLALNLKSPEGLEVAKKLIAWADVCLDSFTAGTIADLGLGYDVVRAINPSIIMASTCLMGQTGPAACLAGYGYHAAAISGFYEVTGWDDRPPGGPFNAYTDTIAPRFLAATLMAALDHRRRTGEGQYVDQAQMESALYFLAPELLDRQVHGRMPRRDGNNDAHAAPHDVYPCAGEDQWCAIAVETDAQWRALRRVLGEPEWAAASALDDAAGRRAQRELIDRHLAAVTATFAARELMERLQAAGVPAGMVQRSSDHQADPQLLHRRFFRPLQHPEMGEVPYEGHQFRIAGYDSGPLTPGPCLGEHSIQVLQEILGYGDEDLARIAASGALV
jgi:crotonobetainyl-CoA:carnitine CoA-transferase CaiB-like acyl-CoA transferase